jgi:hypothetical protein
MDGRASGIVHRQRHVSQLLRALLRDAHAVAGHARPACTRAGGEGRKWLYWPTAIVPPAGS